MSHAVSALAERLPASLRPMATLAYNLLWGLEEAGGAELFAAIDQDRWDRCSHNPVRLLSEARVAVLGDAGGRAIAGPYAPCAAAEAIGRLHGRS